ncbi:MAG: ubiquinone/menaquinone biosynthesis C-methylase UbiE [Cellvibrionaceae bacterium]|jgi:ubiquinone/menaquinone biosynthesis C-methylase UbiE
MARERLYKKETLAEFYRVVRPGGLVIIKDWDHPCFVLSSPGSLVLNRLYEAMINGGDAKFPQMYRDTELPAWLREAGFNDVKGRTHLVERYQPLPAATFEFLKTVIAVRVIIQKAK